MRRGTGVTAGVLAAAVLLLVLWGSGDGSQVLAPPSGEAGPPPSIDLFPPDTDETTQTAQLGDLERGEPREPYNFDWLLIAFGLAVLAIVAALVKWLLTRDIERGEPPEEDDDLDDIDLLLRATDEPAARSALSEGEPRNVVVRCWVSLEDAAATSGLDRDDAETAAEFTRRLLSRWDVDEATTAELADLYREARFSRHPVAPATGERAVELLRSINAQLRARAARRARDEAEAAEDTDGTTFGPADDATDEAADSTTDGSTDRGAP